MYDHSTLMWQEWHCVKSASLKTKMDRRQKAIKRQHNELSLYSHTTGHEHWWKPTSQFMYKISQLQQFVVNYPFFPMYSIKFPWHSTSLTRAINKYYNLWPIKNRQISLHTRNASIGSPFVYTYSDLYYWIL